MLLLWFSLFTLKLREIKPCYCYYRQLLIHALGICACARWCECMHFLLRAHFHCYASAWLVELQLQLQSSPTETFVVFQRLAFFLFHFNVHSFSPLSHNLSLFHFITFSILTMCTIWTVSSCMLIFACALYNTYCTYADNNKRSKYTKIAPYKLCSRELVVPQNCSYWLSNPHLVPSFVLQKKERKNFPKPNELLRRQHFGQKTNDSRRKINSNWKSYQVDIYIALVFQVKLFVLHFWFLNFALNFKTRFHLAVGHRKWRHCTRFEMINLIKSIFKSKFSFVL